MGGVPNPCSVVSDSEEPEARGEQETKTPPPRSTKPHRDWRKPGCLDPHEDQHLNALNFNLKGQGPLLTPGAQETIISRSHTQKLSQPVGHGHQPPELDAGLDTLMITSGDRQSS